MSRTASVRSRVARPPVLSSGEDDDREPEHEPDGTVWDAVLPRNTSTRTACEDLRSMAVAALRAGQVYEAAIAYLRAAYLATEIGWTPESRRLLARVVELKHSARLTRRQRERLDALRQCPVRCHTRSRPVSPGGTRAKA